MLSFEEFAERLKHNIGLGTVDLPMRGTTSLYDEWALDSLQAFQMLLSIEALADVLVPPIEIPNLFTLDDAYRYYSVLASYDANGT